MDNASWKLTVQANLQALTEQSASLVPGTLYGRLGAVVLAPVVAALAARDFAPLVSLFGIIGGVGGNLIANQVNEWRDLNEQELAIELTSKAATSESWREVLDKLLREFSAPNTVASGLSPTDREWFLGVLRQEATQLGSNIVAGDGAIAGDVQVMGDVRESVINIGGAVTQNFFTHPEPTVDPATLRTAYLNRIFNQANTLSLAGVDPKAASDEAEARLSLGAVYTALLTTTSESDEPHNQGRAAYQAERQVSAVAQLNRHRRLVLLGDPGSGKSTFVNFVAICLAGEMLSHAFANLSLLTAPLPDDAIAAATVQEAPPPATVGAWRDAARAHRPARFCRARHSGRWNARHRPASVALFGQ